MTFTKTIPRIYLILALLAAMLVSPLPYSAIALILLVLQVYYIYKPFDANANLTLTFFSLFLMPLTLQPSTGQLFSALLVIPTLPLLDQDLKQMALSHDFLTASVTPTPPHLSGFLPAQEWSLRKLFQQSPAEGRRPTSLLITLSAAILVVLTASLILANWTLALTSAILAAYLIAVSGYILYCIPKNPLQSSKTRVRTIVGDTSKVTAAITSKAKLKLHTIFTSAHPWVSPDSARFKLKKGETKLNISLTPPLSGPTTPRIQALMTDPWGLIQMNQQLEPVEMHVIPKAKYAEWLAKKFLAQASLHTSRTFMTTPSSAAQLATRRGVEYLGSRPYRPGDRLKDIDWKHMVKLNEIVVKEYSEAHELATVIAVNLTVKDPEEADNLAYNLIMLALTLARVTAPAALVAYNHREVLLTTEAMQPREILKKALKLAQNIEQVKPAHRFLQPPNIRQLKRTLTQLEQAKTEPAQNLARLLRLEDEAIQQGVKDHPATRAIGKVAEFIRPPATIAVVSGWNHDTEALLVTLDRLDRQGYDTIKVGRRESRVGSLRGTPM